MPLRYSVIIAYRALAKIAYHRRRHHQRHHQQAARNGRIGDIETSAAYLAAYGMAKYLSSKQANNIIVAKS